MTRTFAPTFPRPIQFSYPTHFPCNLLSTSFVPASPTPIGVSPSFPRELPPSPDPSEGLAPDPLFLSLSEASPPVFPFPTLLCCLIWSGEFQCFLSLSSILSFFFFPSEASPDKADIPSFFSSKSLRFTPPGTPYFSFYGFLFGHPRPLPLSDSSFRTRKQFRPGYTRHFHIVSLETF